VITPTTGVSPELFGVACLKRPASGVPLSLAPKNGEVAGAASFLGLAPRHTRYLRCPQ